VCIDPHQTGFVVKDSDHIQLTKFRPSCAPGKGVSGGAKIFGTTLLTKVDLIILEGENVRPSVRPSVHKKFLRFE